ncbi:MAG: alpha/beta fold hydrolase [Limnothrix sp.]
MTNPRNPVLLVHGFLDKKSKFRTMEKYLTKRGWQTHSFDLLPNYGRKSLVELAAQVKDYAEQNFASDQTFDLVGFSMGGLVTRYYLQRLGGDERVERYVSISAPNHGTIAAVLPLPGIREMARQSEFVADLNRDVATCLTNIKVTWMWTPYDLMILPANSSELPVGREVKLSVPLHPWMVSDLRALEAVAIALSE